MEFTLKRNNLLLLEQILSFKSFFFIQEINQKVAKVISKYQNGGKDGGVAIHLNPFYTD